MNLTKEELNFIEKTAIKFNAFGTPKAAGKIIGYLLICDSLMLSFEEIMTNLKLSKGSTSQTLKELINSGMIEKAVVPLERKSFYKLTEGNELNILDARIASIKVNDSIFMEAQQINNKHGREAQAELIKSIIGFNEFMEKELLAIREKWLNLKKAKCDY